VEEKRGIRKEILARRRGLSPEAVREKSRRIKEKLFKLPEFRKARIIMFYAARGKEVRTEEMIKESLQMGKKVAVPISQVGERDLVLSFLTDYGELAPGAYGILEPKEEHYRPVPPRKLELIVVPGVAFDYQGQRLGSGRGFYDNFLRKVPSGVPRLGLAFQLQIVANLPRERQDVLVDGVITEEKCFFY